MSSLLDYAANAHRIPAPPSPLPGQHARRASRDYGVTSATSWPVDLLPAAALAEDLLARGVTFRRGVGYAQHGAYREPDQIARMLPDLLDDVADTLPTTSAADWERFLGEVLPQIEDGFADWAAEASGLDGLPDGYIEGVHDMVLGDWMRAEDERQMRLLPEHRANDARNRADASALRFTAQDLRTSAAARRRLMDAIRPHLAEQHAEAVEDDAATIAWLASFDGRPVIRRSEISALYAEAGRPGAVPPARLRTLAEDRWGPAVKTRGHFLHRPATAAAS
ncbi:hypothetical protein [Amnibacterium sp.]|uniref:hypothetical protein n=1 Tax=Amnibacterium sp. TaxID=1872496 RepID=UPI003F7B3BCF